MSRVYLDHNATSPLRPDAAQAMIAAMELAGNASSIHAEGRTARDTVEDAREKLAASIGCPARAIVFTSGGTESNVAALSPHWFKGDSAPHLFVSAIEHPSVLQGGQFSAENMTALAVDANGVVDIETAELAFRNWRDRSDGQPFLASVMLANNETGAIQPVAQLADIVHEHGGILHSDMVQAFGKMQLDPGALGIDLATISAHKVGGPKGVGALILLRPDLPVAALMRGGGQEQGYRAGTENIVAIAGFGGVSDINIMEWQRISSLRDRLEEQISATTDGLTVFSSSTPRLPNTSCFAAPGMDAETILMALDLKGIAVSAGSACSSGKVARSHVLDAMGVMPDLASGAIRVSLGWNNTEQDVEQFVAAWQDMSGALAERRRNVA